MSKPVSQKTYDFCSSLEESENLTNDYILNRINSEIDLLKSEDKPLSPDDFSYFEDLTYIKYAILSKKVSDIEEMRRRSFLNSLIDSIQTYSPSLN